VFPVVPPATVPRGAPVAVPAPAVYAVSGEVRA
jgi:hypothetical protein